MTASLASQANLVNLVRSAAVGKRSGRCYLCTFPVFPLPRMTGR